MVSLVDYYGGTCTVSIDQQGSVTFETIGKGKKNHLPIVEGKGCQDEAHQILEFVVEELHALSWLSVSPAFLDQRTTLPFDCDMVQRLRRLLHYAYKDFWMSRV